jgi:dCTP deaminase
MILNDKRIAKLASDGMIDPFVPSLIRQVEPDGPGLGTRKVISYGASSYGYDIRLSSAEFKVFRHIPGTVVNPKRFNPNNLEPVELHSNDDGEYFILPAHSYGLCVSQERIVMPPNVTGILMNKSTLVRCGVVLPATVIEPSWAGHITIEVSNSSYTDVMLFAGEGVAQLLLFEGEPCGMNYNKRNGKYMNQPEKIVMAKV